MKTSLINWKSLVAVMMAVGLAIALACGGDTTVEQRKRHNSLRSRSNPRWPRQRRPQWLPPQRWQPNRQPLPARRRQPPRAQVSWRYPHPPPEPRRYLQSRSTCRNPRVRRARSRLCCRTLAPALDCTGPAEARPPFAGAQRKGCSEMPTTGKDRFSANHGLLRIGRWHPTWPT